MAKWSPQGQVALVTGATGGIGAALVTALRAGGATVVDADLAGRGAAVELDVTDKAAWERVVARVEAEHGRVDLLVNNAGIATMGNVEEQPLEDWQRTFDVNLWGVVHGVRAVYPGMVRRGCGKIVNVASLAGLTPAGLLTSYSASKAAVVGMSRALRSEAVVRGVGVHVVCPGPIDTPLLDTPAAGFNARRFLTGIAGPPYPADRLAEDVLDGLARDVAVIVAPARSRAIAWAFRTLPDVAALVALREIARERRAAGG